MDARGALFPASPAVLAEGAVVERLRRDPRVELHPHIAHAALAEDPAAAPILAAIYREYLDIARAARLPIVCFTPTWRANPERARLAGRETRALNAAATRFLAGIREGSEEVAIGGLMGCRGDPYRPQDALPRAEAARFHAAQCAALAEAGVDFLFAATMPALPEAAGMAQAMSRAALPYAVSFIIGRDGALLDGSPVREAIRRIDGEASPPPLGYFINCVHPSTLAFGDPRLIGFQGNASRKPPSELEGLPELDSEDPGRFAASMLHLHRRYGLRILGGCCGTDARHIRAIAAGLQPTSASFGSGENDRLSRPGS
jgi:homocysteine S-methyltransferase